MKTRNDRKKTRAFEAECREADRALRSDVEQLEILERKGHGECKEAKRLRTWLEGK